MGVLLGSQAQSASRREWEAAQLWLKVEEDETWEASIQLNRTEVRGDFCNAGVLGAVLGVKAN